MALCLILVTGGVRSGKSCYAENEAAKSSQVCYVATAWAGDGEMEMRIQQHRSRRPVHWVTVEEQINLAEVLDNNHGIECVLIDCLGMWVTNLLCGEERPEIQSMLDCLLAALDRFPGSVILVSNEVGWGLVPDNKLGRQFRDLLGLVNQQVAQVADEVVLMVAGCPLYIKRTGGNNNGI
jgi:adenosylcobinamide kinase/adenosylcobinamide-phosphate guanylyltransferase